MGPFQNKVDQTKNDFGMGFYLWDGVLSNGGVPVSHTDNIER